MWQVVGQTKVVSLLQHSLERQTLAHAYLLIGPPHTGKMTLALNLAQALNCEAGKPPCGECPSCQKIASGKHADVQIISLASNGNSAEAKSRTEIGIDQIRQIQHSASLPPFEGKYKMFIIDGAELMSNEAANCLLKTLEEPEDRVIFVLLTTEERLLLSTVISRCQRLELSPLAASEAETALTTRWNIEPEQAKLLTRLSHRRLGWAVSAALNTSLLQQRAEKIEGLLTILDADYNERFAYATQMANQFSQKREAVQETLDLWLDWWRDLMLTKTGCGDTITNIDFKTTLVRMAEGYSLAQITTSINSIQATEKQLRQNANPRLALEVLMLDIPRRNHG